MSRDSLRGFAQMGLLATLLQSFLRLATQYQVTFCDTAYHALAIVQGGVFVTADRKYLPSFTHLDS